jgi:hypothetical protein
MLLLISIPMQKQRKNQGGELLQNQQRVGWVWGSTTARLKSLAFHCMTALI